MTPPQHYYQSVDGWFDYEDVWQRAVVETPEGGSIVEVGCWKGKSLSYLLVEAARSGKPFRILGVDHFQGSPDEPYHLAEASQVDLEAVCRTNCGRAGYPFELLRLASVEAASHFADNSLDFVFIDGAHGYLNVRADVQAWMPRVKWGGYLAGHDWEGAWPGVSLAVSDFIPPAELTIRGVSWLWRKEVPPRGYWASERCAPADEAGTIYIPHVNREDLLRAGLRSLGAHARRTVVIDQSAAGLSPGLHSGSTFRWTGPGRFTTMMNWMQREAARRGQRRFLFMHSDAETTPLTISRLLTMADDLARGARWGVIFTRYDALCCFNLAAIQAVGCWDESFLWYVSDIDFYNRLRWHGWGPAELPGAEVIHHGSQTLLGLGPEERAVVDRDHAWAVDHYRHKWGCHWNESPEGRTFSVPYNGQP